MLKGRFGDSSYDTRTKRESDEDLDDDEDDVDVKKRKLDEDFLPSRSATAPRTMKMMERQWGYLVIDDEKPCMFTVAKFEDMTKRLVHSNLISRMADHLVIMTTTSNLHSFLIRLTEWPTDWPNVWSTDRLIDQTDWTTDRLIGLQ